MVSGEKWIARSQEDTQGYTKGSAYKYSADDEVKSAAQ